MTVTYCSNFACTIRLFPRLGLFADVDRVWLRTDVWAWLLLPSHLPNVDQSQATGRSPRRCYFHKQWQRVRGALLTCICSNYRLSCSDVNPAHSVSFVLLCFGASSAADLLNCPLIRSIDKHFPSLAVLRTGQHTPVGHPTDDEDRINEQNLSCYCFIVMNLSCILRLT